MRSYNIIVSPYQKNTVDTQFYFKQNDYGIPISITVEDYETSGTTAKIVFRLNDGAIREYNITQSGDGTYKYNLSADELCSVGKVIVDLKFYKNNVRESTASFIIYVMQDKVGQIFDSADYSDSISRAIERCDQAVANIQAQANKAIEDVENALLAELNIYDGYDKTTVGFAADARQLNENVVNSFASKVKEKIDSNTNLINALNNNLDTLITWSIPIQATLKNGWTGTLYISKNGLKEIWVRGIIKPGNLDFGTDIIEQLPAEYRFNTLYSVYNVPINGWSDNGQYQAGLTFMFTGFLRVYKPMDTSGVTQNIHVNQVLRISQ